MRSEEAEVKERNNVMLVPAHEHPVLGPASGGGRACPGRYSDTGLCGFPAFFGRASQVLNVLFK